MNSDVMNDDLAPDADKVVSAGAEREEAQGPAPLWNLFPGGRVHGCHRRKDGWIFFLAASQSGDTSGGAAEPSGATEFAFHDFTLPPDHPDRRWKDVDFVRHYYSGSGRTVSLAQTGHLRDIAELFSFSKSGEADGVLRDLVDKVAVDARSQRPGEYRSGFQWHFGHGPEIFSIGRHMVYGPVRIEGEVSGVIEDRGEMLSVRGRSSFRFHDDFADPADRGFEPSGSPYAIEGRWTTRFTTEIFKDRDRSAFGNAERQY